MFLVCCVILLTKLMRFPRVKADGHGFYHCVSRVVEGRFIFQISGRGSLEAERFIRLMRRLEAFSGVRVLTYTLMSNHFHLLCEVPEPKTLSETEVLERIEAGYGATRRQTLQQEIARYRQQPDGEVQIQRLLDGYRKRMYDICFLPLVSLTASALITAFDGYLEHFLPGGSVLAWTIHLVLDICIVTLLFAMTFKFLPDARLSWRDVRLGAALTAALFLVGKYELGLYLGSGAPGSAYGAAGSLITTLIWVYYAAQIVLFGAEFTRVYAQERGRGIRPARHAVRVDRKEIELPPSTNRGEK
jgi:REP element-mobilizing transposase RayT